MTTLLDAAEFTKEKWPTCTPRRWTIERNLRSIKVEMGMEVLRCKTPEMVEKEVWAHLRAYNLVRTEMAEAARLADLSPRRRSFRGTMQAIWAFEVEHRRATGPRRQRSVQARRLTIASHRVGGRPGRCEPRALKRRPRPQKLLTVRHYLKTVHFGGVFLDNSRRGMCNRRDTFPSTLTDRLAMHSVTRRIASAFAVLCGRYGDVTAMAKDRRQSRQALYREAHLVVEAVAGDSPQARIEQLQDQLDRQHAQVRALHDRLQHAVILTPQLHHDFAAVAQAEGVSLSVARRLLQVVQGPDPTPSVATLGRATLQAGHHARALLDVLDEVTRPRVEQAAADEIFWTQPGDHGRRAGEPLLGRRDEGPRPRRPDLGRAVRPTAQPPGPRPRRRLGPG